MGGGAQQGTRLSTEQQGGKIACPGKSEVGAQREGASARGQVRAWEWELLFIRDRPRKAPLPPRDV